MNVMKSSTDLEVLDWVDLEILDWVEKASIHSSKDSLFKRFVLQSRDLLIHERFCEQQQFHQFRDLAIGWQRCDGEETLEKTPLQLHDAAQKTVIVVDRPRGLVKQLSKDFDLVVEGHHPMADRVDGRNDGRQALSMTLVLLDAGLGNPRESFEFVDEVERLRLGGHPCGNADAVERSPGFVAVDPF